MSRYKKASKWRVAIRNYLHNLKAVSMLINETYYKLSFSQEGEDRLLYCLLGNLQSGYYVDVGAHHPKRFSNTYLFYLRGWHGINIDATPGSMKAFNKTRKRDLNLEVAIANREQELLYYQFEEPALNGFDLDTVLRYEKEGNAVKEKKMMPTFPLRQILDKHLPLNQTIHFLNIDVEGFDNEVLESNDWMKYRPLYVLVEDVQTVNYARTEKSKIVKFMSRKNYDLICKTLHTLIFHDSNINNEH